MMDREGFTSFLIGLGVGIGIGMLFAPKTGSETREYLKSRAEEGGAYLRDQAKGAMDKGRDVVSKGREQVSQATEAFREAYREHTGRPSSPQAPPTGETPAA